MIIFRNNASKGSKINVQILLVIHEKFPCLCRSRHRDFKRLPGTRVVEILIHVSVVMTAAVVQQDQWLSIFLFHCLLLLVGSWEEDQNLSTQK